MSVYKANLFIPLIAAGFYAVLLILPQIRRGQNKRQTRWLLLAIAAAILWEFAIFFAPEIEIPNLSTLVLLLSTCILGFATAAFLDWTPSRRLILLVGLSIGAAFVSNLFANRAPALLRVGTTTISFATLAVYLAWFGLSSAMLVKTWTEYKSTRFPWHANRLLFWFFILNTIFLGELLQFIDNFILIVVGQTVRYLGFIGMAYGVASFRIFNVRNRAQRTLAFLIINTVSALPLIVSVIVVLQFSEEFEAIPPNLTSLIIAIIITVGFFLYQSYRQLVERITYRYMRGEGVNPSQVVRNYSQAISRTLDVQQLSLLIIGTISELFETNRGALMLVTKLEDGRYAIDPIPAIGAISRERIILPHTNLFMNTLAEQHQPLLQYDIDFNPEYADITESDREWLNEMAMEVYVPVSGGDEIVGLIAIGPKNSAVPYQPNELDLMQVLADQTVVALQNARLYSELNTQNERIRHLNTDLIDQNEKLEIMDQVKSDFITIASHELRTPLTQVKGYADILSAMNEENALTREQTREIVGHINRATLQLESLITAMLDASQLDVDGMQLTFVKTRLDTILRLATEPLIQAMRERRIMLNIEGVDELPSIQADFKRMVQSFSNLLGNAVKYTPDNGRIDVKAAIVPSQDGEEFLEITVTDTGIGIDPKFHNLIFEKFFRIGDPQLHSTGSTKFKGAGPGLGLPIAKGVIEAHGGRIWVESEGEDEERLPGSSFHIVLPMHPPGADLDESPEAAVRPAYLIG